MTKTKRKSTTLVRVSLETYAMLQVLSQHTGLSMGKLLGMAIRFAHQKYFFDRMASAYQETVQEME